MIDGGKRLLVLVVVGALASCTFRFRERHMFLARRTAALDGTVARHDVQIPQPDGTLLRGWRLRPRAPRHHLVFFYGANMSVVQEYARLHWLAQTYDLDLLAVDFPGYGCSDGTCSRRLPRRTSLPCIIG